MLKLWRISWHGIEARQTARYSLPPTVLILGSRLQTNHKEDHPCTLLRPSTLWLTADNLMARPGALLSSEPQQKQEQQLYASPEELAGQPRTRRSDMFGLAILFCVLFYGLDSITADGQIEAARLGRVPSKVSNLPHALLPQWVPCQPEDYSGWSVRPYIQLLLNARDATSMPRLWLQR